MDTVPSSSVRESILDPDSSRTKSTTRTASLSLRTNYSHLEKKNYFIGILFLLIVVFLWTASSFVTQDLFQDGYEKAFLVTYLNTSAFTLYLLPFLFRLCLRKDASPGGVEYQPLQAEDVHDEDSNATELPILLSDSSGLSPLTIRETAHLAFTFCFIWFIANWSLNASVDYTSVASATILSSTSGFFTLGIGRIFKVETLSLAKIGAVTTSFVGVLLVALSDSSQTSNGTDSMVSTPASTRHVVGDLLALFSAFFYACYVILLKVRIRSESRIDMKMFFGFVGLFNVLTFWLLGVALHFTGIERFELPSTGKAITALLINMAITWLSDYLYVVAMLKTTPLVVTVGLSLTIPVAVIGDFFLGKPAHLQVIAGALLVIISFIVTGIDDSEDRVDARISSSIE